MLEVMFAIILTPIAICAGLLSVGLVIGAVKALFKGKSQ
jgi:hypothetical protein